MPRRDGTGPEGLGPMTGRAAGNCAGSGVYGLANPAVGRGFGMGRGRGGGYGCRNRFYATGQTGWQRAAMFPAATPVQQIDALRGQAEYLEGTLEAIRKQLEALEEKSRGG